MEKPLVCKAFDEIQNDSAQYKLDKPGAHGAEAVDCHFGAWYRLISETRFLPLKTYLDCQ